MRYSACLLAATTMLGASVAYALPKASPGEIAVSVEGIVGGKPVPEAQALCTPTPDGKSDKVKAPVRPAIQWSGVPEGAASIAVFMMDPDVPADFTDASKEGKILSKNAKRQDFFHYAVVEVPATATSLAGGSADQKPAEGRELINDLGLNGYVEPKSAYGGPCPPWNDARVHHYHFIVLALDKGAEAAVNTPPATDCNNPSCMGETAKNTFNRLIASKHVLAKGTVVGTYTLNPKLRTK